MSYETATWQDALSNLITDPNELLTLLELDKKWLTAAQAAARDFPLRVPHSFVARMQKGNPHDPLLRQVLPLAEELNDVPGFVKDPLQEKNVNPIPGLLHKYKSRALVTITSACAVHCRYCFRRHFPYADNNPGTRGWEKLFAYLQADETIHEVILSGGDPLAASDKILANFVTQLTDIPHIKRLRIHTRLPIVLPARITSTFIDWLTSSRLQPVMVVHANHAQELNAEVADALQKLKAANITLLNQSVLLRGVNDNADTLIKLSETLFEMGVLPYYLHLLDKVAGAAHFDIDLAEAKALHNKLTATLSGYLVPKLVYEEGGAPSKLLLSTNVY